jgi:hypothetical protein
MLRIALEARESDLFRPEVALAQAALQIVQQPSVGSRQSGH